jgi:hypothetical protein
MLLEFSGIWCQIVGNYSQDNSALFVRELHSKGMPTLVASTGACFFRVKQPERKLLCSGDERAVIFKLLRVINPVTYCNNPDDLNLPICNRYRRGGSVHENCIGECSNLV